MSSYENNTLLVLFVIVILPEVISWIIVRFLTTNKYYWCKGKCNKCYNWQCKKFRLNGKTEEASEAQK